MTATGRLDPGGLRIVVRVAEGLVGAVEIASTRPVSLASALAGRPVSEAIRATGLLHGLCGRSHAEGLAAAAEAATGERPGEAVIRRRAAAILAERIAEHGRSLFTGGLVDAETARIFLAAPTMITPEGRIEAAAAAALAASAARLPLQSAAAGRAPALPDRLTAEDDAAVVAGLSADPAFVREPRLSGRRPETGPAPRAGRSAADEGAATAARVAEIQAAAGLLCGVGGTVAAADLVRAEPLGPGRGYAVVESARGRLHTLLEVGEDGRLLSARVLAPTEWNFHADGPLARRLHGLDAGGDVAGAVAGLARAFDPCVPFSVAVVETADA